VPRRWAARIGIENHSNEGTPQMRLTDVEIDKFRSDGFLIRPNLFSAAEVAVLRAQLPALYGQDTAANIREKNGRDVRTSMGLHLRDPVFARLARHPRLFEPAAQILGDERLYVMQDKVNVKAAFGGDLWQWHYDFATHHHEDGIPDPLPLNLHIFLDDVNEFNGPLWFIRGSHRNGPAPTGLDTVTTSYELWTVPDDAVAHLVEAGGIVSATGPAGTGLIFGDTLVHGSPPNMSPWPRRIYSLILNPVANRQTRFKRPDHQHHRDFTPVVALADDCLTAP
jgi:ectoine hydroxylase